MGWNTPDDCPWSSDMDYYESRRRLEGPEEEMDERDEEPLPEGFFDALRREVETWPRLNGGPDDELEPAL